jgi:hypothetical protein
MRRLEPSRPLLFAALAALLLAALSGCGLVARHGATSTELLVTRDFGRKLLARASRPVPAGGTSALRQISASYPVVLGSGGSIERLDGVPAGARGGGTLAWALYVNGVRAGARPAEVRVHPGDHLWADLHGAPAPAAAVVGAFPEPFVDGIDGRRLPVRVECAAVQRPPCATVAARLRAAGIVAGISAISGGGGPEVLRVLVGPWPALAGDFAAYSLVRGPATSGVYATIARGGGAIVPLAADGAPGQALGAGTGLVAATHGEAAVPVWLVTGTDEEGVQRAAGAVQEGVLARRFAVAVTAAGVLPLPFSGA